MPWKPTVHRLAGAKPADEVKRELDRQRPSAARRGYGGRWRSARVRYLAEHPLCASCLAEGRLTGATVVDHVVPHGGDRQRFWDESNWQGLCKPCHDSKTVRDGRWARQSRGEQNVRRHYGCDIDGTPARSRAPVEPSGPGGGGQ